ncbi:hypothetical protein [Elioraea tepidiphila]|jgi:hypothetical protein|uniref:hypothetical protein n=1 Tax=Elioraea tepidiphila TaxID=457934 RepID=UPI002FD9AE0E
MSDPVVPLQASALSSTPHTAEGDLAWYASFLAKDGPRDVAASLRAAAICRALPYETALLEAEAAAPSPARLAALYRQAEEAEREARSLREEAALLSARAAALRAAAAVLKRV